MLQIWLSSGLISYTLIVKLNRASHCIAANSEYFEVSVVSIAKAQPGGGWRGSSPPLAIRILMFIFLFFHQHCKSRSGSLQNVLWQKHKQNRRQEVVNRGDLHLCGGALRSCRRAWHSILTNFTNLVFDISICGRFAHQSPPVATGLTTRRSNTFVIKPSGYEFSRFEKYWAAFFIPAWFVLYYHI